MNNIRRKQIKKIIVSLESSKGDIEDVLAEEEATFDNMPENLINSDRGDKISDAIDLLNESITNIESAIENLEEAQE